MIDNNLYIHKKLRIKIKHFKNKYNETMDN
jgi:hypothetical protein